MKSKNTFLKITLIIAIMVVMGFLSPRLVKSINFGLDLQGGFEVLYKVESIDGAKVTQDMVTSTYKTILKRIDSLGVSEPNVIVEGDSHIRIQLAGVHDPESARSLLNKAATLTFRDTNDNVLMSANVLISGGARVGQDNTGRPAVSLAVSDKDTFFKVTKAVSERDDNMIVIWLDFEEGVDSYANTNNGSFCGSTKSNCLSAATVSQGFASDVIIQGQFKLEEVQQLVDLINSGSLPTKLTEISSKSVSSQFGVDALNKTAIAGVIGISIIILILIVLYRFAGLISSIGLLIYTFMTFFTFWLVGGVLTLPGIAALVIGISMAFDSSVINYARIREELRRGKSFERAVKDGNHNSLSSIIDGNLTTLVVAVIMFVFGESAIKGFATLLIISIFITILVMVVLMRYIINVFVETGWFNNHLNLFIGYKEKRFDRNERILSKVNIIKARKAIYLITIIALGLAVASIISDGFKLGIDFKGGSSISIASPSNNLNVNDIEKFVKDLDYDIYDKEKNSDGSVIIKVTDTLTKEQIYEAEAKIADEYDASVNIGVVSNIVRQELIKNAMFSLILSAFAIIIYVTIRFRFSYAATGLIALLHDVLFMFGLFSIFKLEVSGMFIAAVLSIIGYSLNDTIVTFDRIRENINAKGKSGIKNKDELAKIVNDSIVQTLGRSIVTAMTTIVPVTCLMIFGSQEIGAFNIALLIGLIAGCYSTIFIAASLWYDIEKKQIGLPPKKRWYEE